MNSITDHLQEQWLKCTETNTVLPVENLHQYNLENETNITSEHVCTLTPDDSCYDNINDITITMAETESDPFCESITTDVAINTATKCIDSLNTQSPDTVCTCVLENEHSTPRHRKQCLNPTRLYKTSQYVFKTKLGTTLAR